jgi:transcriptional regulator of acetoin/glycerol metabolism
MARLLGLLASDGLDRVDAVLQQAANEQIARDRLTTLLQDSEWNIALAARTQGVTRVTLYKWMRRLGIERMKIRRSLAIARRPAATGR